MTTPASSASTTFVAQLYSQLLRRPADPSGLGYWSAKIDSGAMNASEVSAQFLASAEFGQMVDPVVRMYFAFFGRSPDPAGLSFWVGIMQGGATAQQIGAAFSAAPEFQSLYGGVGDGAFLDMLYQQAFQRTPDAAGKAFYVDVLSHGVSRGTIVAEFFKSPEMTASMGATFKVVEQYLGAQLAPPSAAQIAAGLSTAGSAALFTTLYASDQYHGATVPFLSRAGVVADGYVKGATVTMTIVETVAGVATTHTVTRQTDDHGNFDFGSQAGYGYLVQTGGVDIATGALVNGSYRAVAGSSVINPLTTLVQALSADGKHSAAEAAVLVKASLGIDAAVDLGSYDPIAALGRPDTGAAAQAVALKVQAVLAQVNTAMGQIGAVLHGSGVAGGDAGANASITALARMIDSAAGAVDLASAGTAAQLLRDAGSVAGASSGQAAAIAAIAADAGAAIGNLNHAIADAAGAAAGDAQAHLVAMARVQVAAEAIEAGMASGAAAGSLTASAAATGSAALAVAIAAAAAAVGDVNGDGKADAVLPPAPPAPPAPPPPSFAATFTASGDAWINRAEATSAAVLTASVTGSTLDTVNVVGLKASDGSALEVATIRNNGHYDFDATAFRDGTLTVVATDVFGQVVRSSLTLDTVAPALALTSAATGRVAAPVIGGSAEAGATVTAVIAGATFFTTAANGIWSIDTGSASHTGTLALNANGSNSVSVRAADAAGNVSAAATQTLLIDTTVPTLAVTSAALTKLAAPVVSGTAEAGATVTAVIAGATYTTVATGGAWSIDTATATHTGTLTLDANGSNAISVTALDAVGNASAVAATQTLVIDTTAPVVTVTSGALSNLAAPVVSGTAESGATVTAVIAGATFTTTASMGAWSINTATANHTGVLTLDANGSNSVSVTAVDAAGNAALAAATQTLVIDTTLPTVAITSAALSKLAAPVVSGTAEAGASITAVIGGVIFSTTATGGAWSIDTATASNSGMLQLNVNGNNTITVYAADAAGNAALAPARQTLAIDTIAPAVAVTSAALTHVTAPVVSGTAEAGATVKAVIAGATYTTVATGGVWSFDTATAYHTGTLALDTSGTNSVSVTAADAAGNVSAAATQSLEIVTVAASAFTYTGSSVGATSNVAGALALYNGSTLISSLPGAAFDATHLTNTMDVAGQAEVVQATLMVSDAGGHFASDTQSVVLGTVGDDGAVNGTDADDVIYGFAGNDVISGGRGADVLHGGDGHDTFVFNCAVGQVSDSPGTGMDYLPDFDATVDTIQVNFTGVTNFDGSAGGRGTYFDTMNNSDMHWVSYSHDGGALLSNAVDALTLRFDSVQATELALQHTSYHLTGTGGNDYLAGGGANDVIIAGAGDDTIVGGLGSDTLTGGNGADVFMFAGADSNIADGQSADTITDFQTGVDHLRFSLSGTHVDVSGFRVWGGGNPPGNGAEGDGYYVSSARMIYLDANGNGSFTDAGDYVISLGAVAATDLQFQITGTEAADRLVGGAGSDTIIGGAGDDTIVGGLGNDVLTGGDGADVFVFASGAESNDTSILTEFDDITYRDQITDFTTGVDHLRFSLSGSHVDVSSFAARGGYGDGMSSLSGVAGGGFYAAGESKLYIDANGDGSVGGSNDYAVVSANPIAAADLQFDIKGTVDGDVLIGGVGRDTIFGYLGDDVINGGGGGDFLDGGDGVDTLSYTGGADLLAMQGLDGLVINNTNHDISASTVLADTGLRLAERDNGTDLLAGSVGFHSTSQLIVGPADTIAHFENLTGSLMADVIYGADADSVITGGGGNDAIFLGEGKMTVMVGTVTAGGIDVVHGFGADDVILGGVSVIEYQFLNGFSSSTSVSEAMVGFDGAVGYAYGFELGDGKRYVLINNGDTHYNPDDDIVIELVGTDFGALSVANFGSIST
jgi:Ca2+-binding RTX toxin-like protein